MTEINKLKIRVWGNPGHKESAEITRLLTTSIPRFLGGKQVIQMVIVKDEVKAFLFADGMSYNNTKTNFTNFRRKLLDLINTSGSRTGYKNTYIVLVLNKRRQ